MAKRIRITFLAAGVLLLAWFGLRNIANEADSRPAGTAVNLLGPRAVEPHAVERKGLPHDYSLTSSSTERYLAMEKVSVTGAIPVGQHNGYPVVADIMIANARHVLVPNQIGVFERLYVKPSQEIQISVGYPEANPGDKVVVEMNDGGLLGNGKPTDIIVLNEAKRASFQIKVTDAFGTHRVALYHNVDRKILDFWVGQSEREL